MTEQAPQCALWRRVDRHFAGELSSKEERELRAHVPGCAGCQHRYRRQLLWARFAPQPLSPQERIARGLGLGSRTATPVWRSPRTWGPVLAVAAALTLLVSWPRQPEFQARGSASAVEREFWAYRVRAGKPAPLGDSVAVDDELAFAYFVPKQASDAKFLLVFAVDEHQHVYWYHPAWTDPKASPRAVAVSEGRHELPEAIAHDFDCQQVTLYAVFASSAVSVAEVEAAISQGDPRFTRDAQWSRKVRVEP
jgi:hypothetical protein